MILQSAGRRAALSLCDYLNVHGELGGDERQLDVHARLQPPAEANGQ
jgi:hypothetical protein